MNVSSNCLKSCKLIKILTIDFSQKHTHKIPKMSDYKLKIKDCKIWFFKGEEVLVFFCKVTH